MEVDLQKLITPESVATYSGASIAVWAITNTLRTLLNWNSRWPAFLSSMLVSFMGSYIVNNTLNDVVVLFISFINGCLLYLSSLGLQTQTGKSLEPIQTGATSEPTGAKEFGKEKVEWRTPW